MTAHELARKLLGGPDLLVTRRGYEGGVHEITTVVSPCPIHIDIHSRSGSYYGPHEYHDADYCGWCYDEVDKSDVLGIHLQ